MSDEDKTWLAVSDDDAAAAREILVLAIARKNRRLNHRPTIVNWYRSPFITIGWPMFTTNIYLN